jgi:diguanylate cyclase (GGDEF)-like protein
LKESAHGKSKRPVPPKSNAMSRSPNTSTAIKAGRGRSVQMRLRGPLTGGHRGLWVAITALLVLAGTIASVVGAGAVARSESDKDRLAFHLASSEIASTLDLALQREEDLVISAGAFVTGNPSASAAGFDRWAESVHALQRYPELEDIGLVTLVPSTRLAAFEARMEADPLHPLGPNSPAPTGPLQVLPVGTRPYYCLAVAGLVRNAGEELPPGLDYCAFAPALISTRETGMSSYAPFTFRGEHMLGVEIPVYRGGSTPTTAAGRRKAFWGWLGELLAPKLVVERALQNHPNLAITFRYSSGTTHEAFSSGVAPAHPQTTSVRLHDGWAVQTFGASAPSGIFGDRDAISVLVGGVALCWTLGLLLLVLATQRKRALALVLEKTSELSHQALHDTLTGLPNRALVLDRAERAIARAEREPGVMAGALFIDVDGFKHVNDNLGHAAGDRLLKTVGERLQRTVRAQDTVGRLGGDEFVVLVEATEQDPTLDMLADRLTEVLREPVELDDGRKVFSITASIGVAVGQYSTPDDLLRDADLALYAAKAAGKDRYALFDASLGEGVEGRLELQADLSNAVQAEQFFLLYQPIFDLSRKRVVSVEALIRWRHPTRGIVPPDSFIPLAEETGLIAPIGRWVLEEACRQAGAWARHEMAAGISVNVSAYQLGRKGFAEDVKRALAESGLDPAALTLEITETTLMRDVTAACERLEEIKTLGVRIAIDDFGTGYASLSHLQRMPVDVLKIDRSFVAALHDGGQSRALLQAILGVGEALSLDVVAEGIEDRLQMTTLEEMGCEMAQGFFLGRPNPADTIERLLGSSPSVGTLTR